MAGSIMRNLLESTKIELDRYRDADRVVSDMDAGGCLKKFKAALGQCDRDWYTRSGSGVDRKPAEVVPVDLDACVKATAALRRCMQAHKPEVFREHIVAMDEGIEEDVKLRLEPGAKVEEGARWRWWTGMRNS
ncbi:hypothetical protein ACQ4PT_001044 [Festuca glaucescens]